MKYAKFFNITFVSLLISSIVPLLIWGPFFPDLIVSISVLFFLYHIFKNNNHHYLINKPFIIFILFCTVSIFCSLISENILFSLKSSLFYFRIGVFCCFVWYLIDRDIKFLDFFYYTLMICYLALVIDGYYQFYFKENIFGIEKFGTNRISSFFGDELIMGSYLSRLFPLFFALFVIKKKKIFEIYLICALFILVDILIYISGERTAFFFLNLSTLFIILLIKKYQKIRLFSFVVALIAIVILSLNSSGLTNRMILNPAKNMGIIKSTSKPVIVSSQHDSHFRTAFKMFLGKPILGHGPKMFRINCSDPKYSTGKFPCNTHPHNFYIQLLAETGLVGFSFLLTAFFYVLYCSYRQVKSIILKQERYLSDYQVCLLAGFLITLWPFSPNGNFFNNWLSILYSLPVGFYLHSIYSDKNNYRKLN